MAEDIVIYHSRTRLIFMILGSLAFVFLGYWFARYGNTITAVVGWLSIVFFGACGLAAVWRLVNRTPALIISAQGLFDHASGIPGGLVRWSEIEELKSISFQNQKFLGVFVKDAEAFIAQQPALRRKALQGNFRLVGALVAIPRAALPMNVEKLEALIRSRWQSEAKVLR